MIDDYTLGALIVVVISYLLGSLPTGYLIGKIYKVDIFDIGSGNMGATNVTRALGLRWGIFVLFLDACKGIAAIAISQWIGPGSVAANSTISATAVIVGHNWSLFATLLTGTLRGGKGAATTFGTMIMIYPAQILIGMFVLAIAIVWKTRYVSLGVLSAFVLAFIWMGILVLQQKIDPNLMVYSVLVTAMLAIRFKGNIQRLIQGTERRFGEPT